MIKLIASDLDGTILQNGAQVPSDKIIGLIEEMKGLGIQFVAASGRQYPNLKRMFRPVWQDVIFVAENGGAVLYQDQVLSKTVIDAELAGELIQELYQNELCDVQVSGITSSYVQPKAASKEYVDFMIYQMKKTMTVVEDITSVPDEIISISAMVYDGRSAELYEQMHPRWKERFQVAIAGEKWVDFTLTSKGEAIKKLQQQLGIQREEMVAFGDNFNDLTMFDSVQYSYAMQHADDRVQDKARHSCDTVESVLEKLIAYCKTL